jgi:hypothetical protein
MQSGPQSYGSPQDTTLNASVFTAVLRLDEPGLKREMLEKLFRERVKLLQDLDRQRERTSHQSWLVCSEEVRVSAERLEWWRQDSEKTAELRSPDLTQGDQWARLKTAQENCARRQRERLLEEETARTKKRAGEWRTKRCSEQGAADRPKTTEDSLVVIAKGTCHSKVGAQATQHKKSQEQRTAASKHFRTRENEALKRGQAELLKKEHTRLLAEIEKRKAEEQTPIELSQEPAKPQTPSADTEGQAPRTQLSRKDASPVNAPTVFYNPKPVWRPPADAAVVEERKAEVEAGEWEAGEGETIVERRAEEWRSCGQVEQTTDERSTAEKRDDEVRGNERKAVDTRVEDKRDHEDSKEPNSGFLEDDEDFVYSEVSSESAEDGPQVKRQLPNKLYEDDAVIQDLSARDTDIRRRWRDIRHSSVQTQDSQVASHFSPRELTELGRAEALTSLDEGQVSERSDQDYIDIISALTFSENQPKSHPGKEGLRLQAGPKLKGRVSAREDSKSAQPGVRSQDSADSELELHSQKQRHSKQTHTADSLEVPTHDRQQVLTESSWIDVQRSEGVLRGSQSVKATAWEIDLKPVKTAVHSRVKSQGRLSRPVELDLTHTARGLSQGRSVEAWSIELDSSSKSLSDAFMAKKRALASKLEQREAKSGGAAKTKTMKELLEIRKNMRRPRHSPKPSEASLKQLTPSSLKLHGRLASGERGKVRSTQVSRTEMKQLTARNYDNLPEVKAKREEEAKKAEIKKRIANAKEFDRVRPRQKRQQSRVKRLPSNGRPS